MCLTGTATYRSDMDFTKILLLVLLLHFIADFNLQIGAKLHDMKQKMWWSRQYKRLKMEANDTRQYRNDYKCALFIHALVWSLVTFAPLVYFTKNSYGYLAMIVVNTIVHAKIDDAKANEYILNLIEDQVMHLIQIVLTVVLWYRCAQC